MALVIPNGIKATLLQQLVAYFNTLTLRLFQSNTIPAITDTAGTYSEATFTGYGSVALTTFGVAFLNGANFGETDATSVTFTQTGVAITNNIYGYYVTNPGGALVWAERNPNGVFAMNNTGLTYTVTPIQTLGNLNGT